VIFGSAIKLPD